MIALSVTARGEKRLGKLLQGNSKRLRREMAIAVNATSKKTVAIWAKEVSKRIATAQKNIKATIKVSKKASASEGRSPTAVVTQKESSRISLRDFGARQNKKGVTYRIAKGGKRGFIKSAFIISKFGGHVFERVGKERGPITKKKYGPSPWGVSLKNNLKQPTVKATKIELIKQIERRIRFLKLKQSGAI
jgi:hypothetical protein